MELESEACLQIMRNEMPSQEYHAIPNGNFDGPRLASIQFVETPRQVFDTFIPKEGWLLCDMECSHFGYLWISATAGLRAEQEMKGISSSGRLIGTGRLYELDCADP